MIKVQQWEENTNVVAQKQNTTLIMYSIKDKDTPSGPSKYAGRPSLPISQQPVSRNTQLTDNHNFQWRLSCSHIGTA